MAQIPDTGFTTPVLISDNLYTISQGQEIGVQPTNASCGLELQSTTTAFLISRLTQTQINALTPVDGMIVYNTTTLVFNYRVNGAWATTSGGGGIIVPGVTTLDAVVRWGDLVGGTLLNSVVVISNAGAITGVTGLTNGNGVVGTPSFNFTTSTGTGMWSSGANTIDFSTNGLQALRILPVGAAVNSLTISPSATTTPILLSAVGTDANIGIELVPQGTGAVIIPVGAAATPSLVFVGRTTTGMFSSAANTVDFSTNGLESFQITTVAAAANWLRVTPSATTTPVLLSAQGTDVNVGIELVSKGTGSVIVPAGTVGHPGLVFHGDTTTGFYDVAAGTIGLSISGSQVANWSAKGLSLGATNTDATTPTNTILLANGTAPAGASPADTIELYSTDAQSNSLTVTTLGIAGEGVPVVAITLTALDHSFPIVINGMTYYVPCKTMQN